LRISAQFAKPRAVPAAQVCHTLRAALPGAWLILPTYNEAANVEAILRAALAQLATTGREHTILVVDDNSPDGTGRLADGLAGEHPEIRVMHRSAKLGLGRAYLAGFAEALANGAELILEMDADFSHDPADLPRLIAAADAADLVLGSRYVPGGGIENWGMLRRILSRGGSWYARVLLGVPVRDLTGGFKCFNRRVLEALDLSGVHADGYGFQIELTYRAIQAGFTVTEVPILFRERREGHSKMTARIALEAVWKVPGLRLRG
jgi:dolichol-phosphate mannosyltransferase